MASDALNRIAASIHKHKKGMLFGKPRSQIVKHPGTFKKYAERHGESTHEAAEKEKGASGTLGRRARLALAFETMRKKKKEG
jgi:hypothetical protein